MVAATGRLRSGLNGAEVGTSDGPRLLKFQLAEPDTWGRAVVTQETKEKLRLPSRARSSRREYNLVAVP